MNRFKLFVLIMLAILVFFTGCTQTQETPQDNEIQERDNQSSADIEMDEGIIKQRGI